MMKDRKFINPLEIKDKIDLPVIVLVDDLRGFISLIIKNHTDGNYSHCMWLFEEGNIATQSWIYRKLLLKRYMTKRNMLKFWRIRGLSERERWDIIFKIAIDLKQPWYKRLYDVLGILGQFLKIRQIQSPFRKYCSERVAGDLRTISSLKDIIPKFPAPSDLNKLFNQNPDKFERLGYWISNNED